MFAVNQFLLGIYCNKMTQHCNHGRPALHAIPSAAEYFYGMCKVLASPATKSFTNTLITAGQANFEALMHVLQFGDTELS